MNGIGPVSGSSAATASMPRRIAHDQDHAPTPRQASDRIELSDQARGLNTASRVSTARPEVIQRVRAEIKANRYETQEKIDIAIERMASSLTAELC